MRHSQSQYNQSMSDLRPDPASALRDASWSAAGPEPANAQRSAMWSGTSFNPTWDASQSRFPHAHQQQQHQRLPAQPPSGFESKARKQRSQRQAPQNHGQQTAHSTATLPMGLTPVTINVFASTAQSPRLAPNTTLQSRQHSLQSNDSGLQPQNSSRHREPHQRSPFEEGEISQRRSAAGARRHRHKTQRSKLLVLEEEMRNLRAQNALHAQALEAYTRQQPSPPSALSMPAGYPDSSFARVQTPRTGDRAQPVPSPSDFQNALSPSENGLLTIAVGAHGPPPRSLGSTGSRVSEHRQQNPPAKRSSRSPRSHSPPGGARSNPIPSDNHASPNRRRSPSRMRTRQGERRESTSQHTTLRGEPQHTASFERYRATFLEIGHQPSSQARQHASLRQASTTERNEWAASRPSTHPKPESGKPPTRPHNVTPPMGTIQSHLGKTGSAPATQTLAGASLSHQAKHATLATVPPDNNPDPATPQNHSRQSQPDVPASSTDPGLAALPTALVTPAADNLPLVPQHLPGSPSDQRDDNLLMTLAANFQLTVSSIRARRLNPSITPLMDKFGTSSPPPQRADGAREPSQSLEATPTTRAREGNSSDMELASPHPSPPAAHSPVEPRKVRSLQLVRKDKRPPGAQNNIVQNPPPAIRSNFRTTNTASVALQLRTSSEGTRPSTPASDDGAYWTSRSDPASASPSPIEATIIPASPRNTSPSPPACTRPYHSPSPSTMATVPKPIALIWPERANNTPLITPPVPPGPGAPEENVINKGATVHVPPNTPDPSQVGS